MSMELKFVIGICALIIMCIPVFVLIEILSEDYHRLTWFGKFVYFLVMSFAVAIGLLLLNQIFI